MLQYVSTGSYYGRTKTNGKLVRRGLKANTFEEAKLALHDFLTKEAKRRHIVGAPVTFGEALGLYESSIDNDHTLSVQSRYYRHNCVKRLKKSWPGIEALKLRAIKQSQCEAWASKLAGEIDAQYFNNILGTFRAVLKRGGIGDDENPLAEIKRMGIEQVPPTLPEPDQFLKIIAEMESSGAGQQQECADFARFLAFSGCRLSEARTATFADVDLNRGLLTVHNAKVRRARNWKPTRLVPIIPDMKALLARLMESKPELADPICKVGECEKSLARACGKVGIPKLTHHDLRHLFATRCIEAGVDIPTVSRWLGHSDGGALAMKVYGHLREKHSAEMAKRVTFDAKPAENVIPLSKEAANG
jgi:integrase